MTRLLLMSLVVAVLIGFIVAQAPSPVNAPMERQEAVVMCGDCPVVRDCPLAAEIFAETSPPAECRIDSPVSLDLRLADCAALAVDGTYAMYRTHEREANSPILLYDLRKESAVLHPDRISARDHAPC